MVKGALFEPFLLLRIHILTALLRGAISGFSCGDCDSIDSFRKMILWR